jgi:hypothetical protein
MPIPPITTSGSTGSGKSATAVSARGGKLAHANSGNLSCSGSGHKPPQQHPLHQQTLPQHQPVSFQIDLPSQDGYPAAQHRVGTQQATTPFLGSFGFRGGRGGAAVSGAAAAVMQQQPMHEFEVPAARNSGEEAFGRTFHSPPDHGAESSMISGVSVTPSGMSGISALTDPISAVAQSDLGPSRMARQAMQLDRLRPNWTSTENPAPVQMLNSSQHGVPNTMSHLNAHSIRSERKYLDDNMSWAGHSLHGGGLSVRDDSVLNGAAGSVFSSYSTGNDSFGVMLASMKDDAFLNAAVDNAPDPLYSQTNYNDNMRAPYVHSMPPPVQHQQQSPLPQPQYQQQYQQPYRNVSSGRNHAGPGSAYLNDGASVASISMVSGVSLPSVGDLSETLSALDLASYQGS